MTFTLSKADVTVLITIGLVEVFACHSVVVDRLQKDSLTDAQKNPAIHSILIATEPLV